MIWRGGREGEESDPCSSAGGGESCARSTYTSEGSEAKSGRTPPLALVRRREGVARSPEEAEESPARDLVRKRVDAGPREEEMEVMKGEGASEGELLLRSTKEEMREGVGGG
jgi:hypothetical protein